MFTFASKPATSESNSSTDSIGFKFTPANSSDSTTTTTFKFGDISKTSASSDFKFNVSTPSQGTDNSSSKVTEVKTDFTNKAPVFTFGSQPASETDNSNQANAGDFKFKFGANNPKATEQDNKTGKANLIH